MRMHGYCGVYKWAILRRASPEVKCLHPTSSRREMCTSSVSNVIYHKGLGSIRGVFGSMSKISFTLSNYRFVIWDKNYRRYFVI